MIAFPVRGRVVSVLCGDVDPALADVQLNVVLDQDRSLDPGDVVSVEAGPRRRWRVQLPAELYEGHAHHIGLQIKMAGCWNRRPSCSPGHRKFCSHRRVPIAARTM
jgi:hypothetical protein